MSTGALGRALDHPEPVNLDSAWNWEIPGLVGALEDPVDAWVMTTKNPG